MFRRSLLAAGAAGALITVAGFGPQALAGGNRELMSIKMAQAQATRALAESVVGLKIKSKVVAFADAPAESSVESKVAAELKGVTFNKPKYDSQKDVAVVEARIDLNLVQNVIGKTFDYKGLTVKRLGFGTSSEGARDYIKALRAAELDAYDQLARTLVGQEITGRSRVENMVVESDEVRTRVMAAVWGAQVVDYGWEENGNAFMKLRLDADFVRNIFGGIQKNVGTVEVTGYGATVDDTKSSANKPYDSVTVKMPGGAAAR
ncbi:MAG TPA: LPP20 family lipoprotein [Azospirillum sp.]|nr:LPP20 family lipoprotein [Azospirillum sp.]